MNKMTLRTYFKKHFPPFSSVVFCIFWNMRDYCFDVVCPSGDILFSVPEYESLSDEENIKFARAVVSRFHDDYLGRIDILSPLFDISMSDRFDYPDCFGSEILEFCYHPDDFTCSCENVPDGSLVALVGK